MYHGYFLIDTPGKNTHARRENKKHETIGYVEHEQKAKNTNIEMSELEERYQEIVDQVERENAAAAAEAESTLDEAVAQEIERRSMKRSSKVANQRGGTAQHEHRRQHGWTSTPRGSDDGKKGSERDMTAGERLQNQRPHPPEKIEDEEGAHEIDTEVAAAAAATCWQGSDCRNNAHTVMSNLNTIQKNILSHKFRIRMKRQVISKEVRVTTSAAAKESEESLDKDAEILRLIEERRSTPKEEKQRLKDLSKRIKKASEKKKE